MAMADMTRPDAKAKVRQMRLLRDHPEMAGALADADISKSLGAGDRGVDQEAPGGAARGDDQDPGAGRPAGASRDDLRMIAAVALAEVARLTARRR